MEVSARREKESPPFFQARLPVGAEKPKRPLLSCVRRCWEWGIHSSPIPAVRLAVNSDFPSKFSFRKQNLVAVGVCVCVCAGFPRLQLAPYLEERWREGTHHHHHLVLSLFLSYALVIPSGNGVKIQIRKRGGVGMGEKEICR